MPFTTPTLAEAKTALAARLFDPNRVRWVGAELTLYIQEALRTWNAWTAYWRDSATFNTVMLQAFYDLPTVIPTLRGQTLTTWNLVTDLQYALLEPAAAGGTWTGTAQFDLDVLSAAIQRRRDQFLRETGAVLTRTETNYPAPPASGKLDLDEAVLIVRRAAWRPTATQLLQPLIRTTNWAADHYAPTTWLTSTQAPSAYATSDVPPITLQIIPPATADGTLDLVSINKGATIDPLVAAPLGVPDDFAWVIKYGALADLLQEDVQALDPQRAQYCEMRWQQGVEMAKRASVVIAGRINDAPCLVNSLNEADRYSPLWQLLAGVPNQLLTAGQTLLATWPPANSNAHTVTLDVVRNAPVPSIGTDILQISADVYDSILDIAQHTALFKEGPGTLELAQALIDRAARAAGVELKLQQAKQPERRPALQQTRTDEYATARELDSVPID